jgi:hypothetical protein
MENRIPTLHRVLFTAFVCLLGLASSFESAVARTLYEPGTMRNNFSYRTAADELPFITLAVHNVGKIALTVTNQGTFGNGFLGNATDPISGTAAPSCEFPKNSSIDYLFAASFWLGGIIGRDTLVSTGADGWANPGEELNPPSLPQQQRDGDTLTFRTISDPESAEFGLALSQQDVIMAYADTLVEGVVQDVNDSRPHIPLGIKIKQSTYAWSYSYAEDFVLFDYRITNIGNRKLEKFYMGFYVDADVGHLSTRSTDGFSDDICGFKLDVEQLDFGNTKCVFTDTIRIAWIADNDGDNSANPVPSTKTVYDPALDPTGVTGMRVVRTPSDSLKFSFNWWISNGTATQDFGPRLAGTEEAPFRDFGGYLGTPEGDKNKYYIMSHEEFDYDQLFSAVDHTPKWLPPGDPGFADGFDTRYLLSFGPFEIFQGETLPLTFAYVAGDDFHRDPNNMVENFNAQQPERYNDLLDFSDFGVNAQWAAWIYDNPGVDTDGDGFRGKFRLCIEDSTMFDTVYDTLFLFDTTFIPPDSIEIDTMIDTLIPRIRFTLVDTVFYEGDGVPDFRGASPPPAPKVRLETSPGKLVVRWNGLRSETTPDPFSDVVDFEGYRVYMGLDNRATDMVLQSSYDRENFTRFFFNPLSLDKTTGELGLWEIAGPPQTLPEIRFLYASNNQDYNPLDNSIASPLRFGDSLFYFIKQDFNRDDLTDTVEIHKPAKYLNEPYPHTLFVEEAFTSDTFLIDPNTGVRTDYIGGELTDDGLYFKYFEYEYTLDDLLSSQRYFVSVTAFDFGAPESGLDALETSPLFNAIAEFPLPQTDEIIAKGLGVSVYPNPYRIDGNYRDDGFEGRGTGVSEFPNERVRAINFINLPPVCMIRIYSLDGDLVREIEHNTVPNSPGSMHDKWDIITRNITTAVSGIYYWTVEEPDGKVQMGKLVLIM